jgi:glycerol-3-phosphate acyltransferase PlsY
MIFITVLTAAYLIGSISSAILICRIMHLPDPRTTGSHNPGATNVLRIGTKKAAVFTLLGDALKGFLPVFIARYLGWGTEALSLIALAAFLGHLYPIFFGFKGGKGVATALGSILALSWPAGVCLMGTWLIVAMVFRYSSLAALVSAIFAPIYIIYFTGYPFAALIITLMSILLIYKHKKNISQLIQGKENQIGKRLHSDNGKRG